MILIWAFWSISSTWPAKMPSKLSWPRRGCRRWDTPCSCASCTPRGPGGADGQTQRELAQLLHVSPAAVATSLKSLEKKGYICREPEPGDARRNRVTLTDKGQRAVDDCFACLQRVTRRAFTGLSNEEQAVLRGFYLRMLDNLRGNSRPHSTPKEES